VFSRTQFVADKVALYVSLCPNTHAVISIILLNLAVNNAGIMKPR
jgi:hypothetical protein